MGKKYKGIEDDKDLTNREKQRERIRKGERERER